VWTARVHGVIQRIAVGNIDKLAAAGR
jgi:hypothetical protein